MSANTGQQRPAFDWTRWMQNQGPLPFGGGTTPMWDQLLRQGQAQERPLGQAADWFRDREAVGEAWEKLPGDRLPGGGPLANPLTVQPDGSVAHQPTGTTPPATSPAAAAIAGASGAAAAAAANTATQVNYGATFVDPGGGWNPWMLYDGREGFDGQAVDGWYDQRKDSPKWELAGRGLEKDRDRVWRWTLDALGPNPGGQPIERVKQVFLQMVARLRRDYLDTPGLGAAAWANSAFAGYERMPGSQVTPPKAAPPATPPATATPPTATVSPGTGANPAPAPPPASTPPATTPPATTPPAGGGGGDVSGVTDQGGSGREAIDYTDPAARQAELLRVLGLDSPRRLNSYFGNLTANAAPDLFEAWRQTQGMTAPGATPSPTNWGDLFNTFATTYNSPGAIGKFQQAARAGLGTLGQWNEGMKQNELMPLVQAFNQLLNFGSNAITSRASANLADQSMPLYLQAIHGQTDPQTYWEWIKGNPLFSFLTGGN